MNRELRRADEEILSRVAQARKIMEDLPPDATSAQRAEAERKFDAIMAEAKDVRERHEAIRKRLKDLAELEETTRASQEINTGELRAGGAGDREIIKRLEKQERISEDIANTLRSSTIAEGVQGATRSAVVRAFLHSITRRGEKSVRASEQDVELLNQEYQRQYGERWQEVLERAATPQAAGGAATGGNLLPKLIADELVASLATAGPMANPEVVRYIMTEDGNEIGWPTTDQSAAVGEWIGENVEAGDGKIEFGQITLRPKILSSKMVLVPESLMQDAESLWNEILEVVFNERIYHSLNQGITGVSEAAVANGPSNPVITRAKLVKSGAARDAIGGGFKLDHLIDTIQACDPRYRMRPSFGLQIPDGALTEIMKTKVGNADARYVWEPGSIAMNLPPTLWGYRYWVNQSLAWPLAANKSSILAGDFKRIVVRQARSLMIKALMERYAEKFQVGFVGFGRYDGTLLDSQAVARFQYKA